MGGLFLLLALCVIMAVASFLAGALPLSMTLSQSQLRLISSIGVGILVGTSLVVIIPEGIEALLPSPPEHSHTPASRVAIRRGLSSVLFARSVPVLNVAPPLSTVEERTILPGSLADRNSLEPFVDLTTALLPREEEKGEGREGNSTPTPAPAEEIEHDDHTEISSFYIGFPLILGFILMFLIDRIPRHATESLQSAPPPVEVSLNTLGLQPSEADEESAGFLGSITPTPRQSRSLATTIGLVIHAAADGIAMGASSSTSNLKLGFIVFFAILIHKAPAAFGLTSVLLKQGLSKRAARGHLLVFSLAAPVGAITTWFLITLLRGGNLDGESGRWWTGILLLFSAGTFLYVAMHALEGESASGSHSHNHNHGEHNGYVDGPPANSRKQNRPQVRDTLVTVGGMLLPLLTQIGHHH